MAMMEITSNLKTSGRFFQVFDLVSQIKSVKKLVWLVFFQNSFDFASLVV